MRRIKKFNEKLELINEATHERFIYENIPNPIIDRSKNFIINNPHIARGKNPEECDFF